MVSTLSHKDDRVNSLVASGNMLLTSLGTVTVTCLVVTVTHVLVKVMSIQVAFVKVAAMVKVEVVVLRVLIVSGAVLLQFQHAELQVLRSLLRLAQLLPQLVHTLRPPCSNCQYTQGQVQWRFTSTETILRTTRDREPRTATPTATQFLSSDSFVQCCFTSTEDHKNY